MDEAIAQEAKQVLNDGFTGMAGYVMPIVLILSLMAIFAFRVILLNGIRIKGYMFYSALITASLVSTGITVQNISEGIAEPIVSGISTVIAVLFIIQVIIQIKFKGKTLSLNDKTT